MQAFKFMRLIVYVSLLNIVKQNPEISLIDIKISNFWTIFIFYLIFLPLTVILSIYSIYSRIRSRSRMSTRGSEKSKSFIIGMVYMLVLLYSVLIFVIILTAFWDNTKDLKQNSKFRAVLLAAGIFYTIFLTFTLIVKAHIL